MPALAPFTPGSTVTLALSVASARVALPASGDQIRIVNPAGGQMAYVRFGDVTAVAVVTDLPIQPGATEVFTVPRSATHIAGILSTSTTTIYVTRGDGQ